MSKERRDSKFIGAARWTENNVVEYGPTLMVAIAGIGWTLGRSWILEAPAGEAWLHFVVRCLLGIVLTALGILGAIFTYKRSGSIKALKLEKSDLEAELNNLQDTLLLFSATAKDAWRMKLANIFSDLELDNTFRLNIYRYSTETRTFRMLGRYSPITKYNKTGRGIYPAEIGCIGEAWESPTLEAIADDLPDNEEEYIAESCRRWNLTDDIVRGLNMKSRSVYAFTIMDALGIDRTAVIVFESTSRNAGNIDTLRNAVNVTYKRQILSDLESFKFIEPSPEMAQKAGF